ncbi:MAG TPA: Hsp70 family protein [Blastocatellia bacterium]|nr:Hsp70 family protein [Blastocatellia bacterium]
MGSLALLGQNVTAVGLPRNPIRVLGIDLGTTNSTVAEIVWDPAADARPRARCIEVVQPTAEGQYIHVLVPSVVALHGGEVFIGEGAKRLRSRAVEHGLEQNKNLFYECKNDIGLQKTYHRASPGFRSAAEIGGRVLAFLHEAALEETSGTTPREGSSHLRTVVTVPASFQAGQRNDTLRAADLAGLKLEGGDLLDEPLAAFLDYLMTKGGVELSGEDEKKLVVFDFGGGTCDVAVFAVRSSSDEAPIAVSPLAVSRYHRLGGGDIDAAIVHEVLIPELMKQNSIEDFDLSFEDKKKLIEPALLSLAEALKVSLCLEIERRSHFDAQRSGDKSSISVKQPGRHECRLKDRTMTLQSPTLSAACFEELLEPFLDRDLLYARETEYRLTGSIFAPLEDALKRAGLNSAQVDYCLMVGGSSLIPQVRTAVASYFAGGRLLAYDDRDSYQTATARGAAYHALARAIFGKGLVQPITNDEISIRTATGEHRLIPKGVALPFPGGRDYARSNALAVPESLTSGLLPLRVEIVAGEERRQLLVETWTVTPPVDGGEPLALEYRLDENQVLDLKLWLAGRPERGEFTKTLQNPLTNVVNPSALRLVIEETEEKLRSREVTPEKIPDTLADLGSKYADLGQREKALDYLKRALAGKSSPDPWILNQMGMIAGELGDHKRQEKFYREAGAIASHGAPWFNLALAQQGRGRIAEAIESIERALSLERQGPYLVLRGMLAEKLSNESERNDFLQEALACFNPISAQTRWELGWYITATRMLGDQLAASQADAELQRRARGSGSTETVAGGRLPIEVKRG